MKNYKSFLGRGTAPSPDSSPQGLRILRIPLPGPYPIGAFGASTLVPSMGNCHGCPQILGTPLSTGDIF